MHHAPVAPGQDIENALYRLKQFWYGINYQRGLLSITAIILNSSYDYRNLQKCSCIWMQPRISKDINYQLIVSTLFLVVVRNETNLDSNNFIYISFSNIYFSSFPLAVSNKIQLYELIEDN